MKARKTMPNVIVLMTTQWRAQATGYSGDGNANTPFLDGLAENSIDFFQAVTPHPFGVFARAAFLTGAACPENGISDYYDPLPERAKTLAHAYQKEGYETAFFGKWQLFERDRGAPVVGVEHAVIEVPEERRGGFAFWEGFESGFLLNDGYYHGSKLGSPVQIEGYQSDVIVDRFSDFLQTRIGVSPLFAFVSMDAPHPPYGDSAAGVEPRDPDLITLPPEVPDDREIRSRARKELSGYYAHIEATDRAVGNLVSSVKRHLSWEDTIFVFTSAHGDMHGSHGLFRKGWPHEESVRVPLLLSWPSVFRCPRRDPLLISLLDLGPTLLGLTLGSGTVRERLETSEGLDLARAIHLQATGPEQQTLSMPSSPPFADQCPYAWTAERTISRTRVSNSEGKSFALDH